LNFGGTNGVSDGKKRTNQCILGKTHLHSNHPQLA